MPKKLGENTKAVEARARKGNAMKEAEARKQKEQEDAYWQDDDKQIARKQNRKQEKEMKRLETTVRKQVNKQMAEEELESAVPKSHQAAAKITQAQIAAENERREAAARKASAGTSTATRVPKPPPIEENLNRLLNPDEEARTVDEALRMLSVDDGTPVDRHPERRVKAAYTAFESIRLPQLKAENPSLRLSQLKQMLFTEWQKSPANPMNKEKLEYNAT
jgi:hypothetical protein